MISQLKTFALAGILIGCLAFLPGCGPDPVDVQPAPVTQQDELLQLNSRLTTQYQLFQTANNTARYTATINGRSFSASAKVDRDQDFKDHNQAARDAYNRAYSAYNARDARSCEQNLRVFSSEIKKMNSIGWWDTMHKLRTSSDQEVQQRAYDSGYRDNKSWEQWHNSIVLPRTSAQSLWTPNLSASGGSANFGPAPDFNDAW